jgi:hypothetical protein
VDNNWQTDNDELGTFPSAASPLTSMGIDPDEARANPELMARLTRGSNPPSAQQRLVAGPGPGGRLPSDAQRTRIAVIGQTGGAGDASTPSAPSVPAAGAPTDAHGYGMEGLGTLSKAIKGSSQAAEDIQTQTPQEITDLQSRREKLATPAPRFDPKTGKPLATTQEYDPDTRQMVDVNPKASTGQKIWRGLRSAVIGLLTGGIPGAAVGAIEPQDIRGGEAYNAPNKQYQQAETRREQQLGATDTSLDNARKNWAEAVKARLAQASEYGKVAGLGKDIVTGATGLINAENKPETEENKTKAKLELTQKEFQERQRQLQSDPRLSKLPPIQKALYLANGKLPDPREPNEAEINAQQIARGMTIFKNSHGGKAPATLEEWNSVMQASKGELGKGGQQSKEDQIEAGNLRTAARSAEKHLHDLQDLSKHSYLLPPDGKKDLQDKIKAAQDEYDDLQSQLTGKGEATAPAVVPPITMNQRRGGSTGIVPAAPAQPAPAAAAPPAPPAAAAAQPPAKIDPKNLPKQVMVKGKGMRNVIGYNDKTGKVIVAPEVQ